MKRNEIYEEINRILMTAIEYGEAQRDVERQIHNEFREEPIENTIKYSHEMYMILSNEIFEFADNLAEELKKEAEETD